MKKGIDEGYVDCDLHLSTLWFRLYTSNPFEINSSFKLQRKNEIVMRG